LSYSHTFIVPQDPNFVPSDEQAARGKEFLDKKLGGDYAPAIIYKSHTPRLYSTEENWTSFTCPRCQKLVKYTSRDEALSYWWYTSLYGLCKPDEILTVPCCNSEIAGKEFDFGEDAVFSLFALTVEEVDIIESGYFTQEDIHALEASLGFKMRIIIAKGT
jgi:hypothetical protein